MPDAGLLPCNVVAREAADKKITAAFIDPGVILQLLDNPVPHVVSEEAKARPKWVRGDIIS